MLNIKLALVSIIGLSLIAVQVDAQCMKLIPGYHECFASPGVVVNDDYYKLVLGWRNTSDLAMQLFKTHYDALSICDPSDSKCSCFRRRMNGEPDYGYFFNRSRDYTGINTLVIDVRRFYRLKSIDEINSDSLSGRPLNSAFPSLNDFCHQYDYSYQMDFFFQETRNCKIDSQAQALIKCTLPAVFSNDAYEKFLKCSYKYRKCGNDIKNFLALGDVARYPSMVKGDLYPYIQSLTSGSASIRFTQILILPLIAAFYLSF